MHRQQAKDKSLWHRITSQIRNETSCLDPKERDWILSRLGKIADIQKKIHDFFLQTNGPQLCSNCLGTCCDRGKNHLTLVNLLTFFLNDQTPPEPDFSRPCPFLGPAGCRLTTEQKPFNCITFICEVIENRLCKTDKKSFYALEKQLRTLYIEFDHRYSGASMRGIFIRAERLAGLPFLNRH